MNGRFPARVGPHTIAADMPACQRSEQQECQPQTGNAGYDTEIQITVTGVGLGSETEAAAFKLLNVGRDKTDLLQIYFFYPVQKQITIGAFTEDDTLDSDE